MKANRLETIIKLISENDVETQEELKGLLLQEGFDVTQATVSRDIKALNLQKVSTGRKSKYVYLEKQGADNSKYLRVFKDAYAGMDVAGNLLVIKTVSGMAMAVAAALDNLAIDELVGSIAGDDTIMCATRSNDDAEKLLKKINELLATI